MLTLRFFACFSIIALIGNSADAEDSIGKEITQEYVEAGGIPRMVRGWNGVGVDSDLPGQVPGFHFSSAPTRKLPSIPVPCGLTLSREMFYSNLPVNPTPTGADLTPFLHLENLTNLSLDLGGQSGKKIIEQVWQFKNLKHLRIQAYLEDHHMTGLATLKSLESLDLDYSRVTDEGISKLGELKNLKALDLGSGQYLVKGTGFADAQKFQKLSILILPESVNDEGLACVAKLDGLRILKIPGILRCTDEGISKLGNLPNLKTLEINCSQLSDHGLKGIGRLEKLRHLDIGAAKVTNDGLHSLANLQQLRTLKLTECERLSDMRSLAKLPQLRTLNLTGCTRLTNLPPLSNLRELQSLSLGSCKELTDDSFEGIGKLQHLSNLWIPRVSISDAGVKHIAKLKNLKTLSLWGNKVTDKCIDDLATMTTLRELYLGRTNISLSSRERLQKLLPECGIY